MDWLYTLKLGLSIVIVATIAIAFDNMIRLFRCENGKVWAKTSIRSELRIDKWGAWLIRYCEILFLGLIGIGMERIISSALSSDIWFIVPVLLIFLPLSAFAFTLFLDDKCAKLMKISKPVAYFLFSVALLGIIWLIFMLMLD